MSGLRGVYLASQLAEGVTEESLRPPNLTTLISFNSGATWQPVQGPKTDHEGNPVQGCYQVNWLCIWFSFTQIIMLQWAKCPSKSSGADCDLKKIIPVGKVFNIGIYPRLSLAHAPFPALESAILHVLFMTRCNCTLDVDLVHIFLNISNGVFNVLGIRLFTSHCSTAIKKISCHKVSM